MNQNSFSSLNIPEDLVKNLASLNYDTMTPIQAVSLPSILTGKDVVAQAKTGSGKTVAFGIGLIQKLDVRQLNIQSVVLCPTRELADQVANEIRKLARIISNIKVLTLCGGVPLRPQANSLHYGAHILVGTPGRIEDHINKGTLDLTSVNTLVLDEADRMLAMGFADSLKAIIRQIPKKRQTLLFSATFADQLSVMTRKIMVDPVLAKVDFIHDESSIQQHFYKVIDDQQRLTAVRLLLLHFKPESTLVFCNTKVDAQIVANELITHGFSALALHGDLDQKDRDQTLVQFANKSVSVIVATDVAARGLDIDCLDTVINYHAARDSEVHIHRIGRTGRAGSKGNACSLYSEKEAYKVSQLETKVNPIFDSEALPPLHLLKQPAKKPAMATLQIDGGKKKKLRPGDILGALTAKDGITAKHVGKINISENWAYVAVRRDAVKSAFKILSTGKLKGRSFRVRRIGQ